MTACAECGGPTDPDTIHVHHYWDCDWGGGLYDGCDCPELCASCCTDPDCPLRNQETPT